MRILWKRLQPGLRIETWRLKVLSFSALLQSFAHEHCFDLFYIIFSWTFLEFETGTLLITLNRRVELITNWPEMANVWLSLGGGSRFCDVIFFSANAIKRLINNEWRSFVFEKSLNCRNEISNIVIFKIIKAQVLANKPAHFWTFFFLF